MPDSSVSRWLSSQPSLRKHRPQLDPHPPAPSSPWAMAPSPSYSPSDDDDVSFTHVQPLFEPDSPSSANTVVNNARHAVSVKDPSLKDPYSSRTWTASHPSSLTLTSPYAALETSPPLSKSLSQPQSRSSFLHSPPPQRHRSIHSSAASMYPSKDDAWLTINNSLSPPNKLPKSNEQRLSQSLKWRQFSSPSVDDISEKRNFHSSTNNMLQTKELEMSDVFTFSDDDEVNIADSGQAPTHKTFSKGTAPTKTSPLAATKPIQKSPKSTAWSTNNSIKPSNPSLSQSSSRSAPNSVTKPHTPVPITSHNNNGTSLIPVMPWIHPDKKKPQTRSATAASASPQNNIVRLHPPSARKAGSAIQEHQNLVAGKGPIKLLSLQDPTATPQSRLANGNSLSKSQPPSTRSASKAALRLVNVPRSQSLSSSQLSKLSAIKKNPSSSTQSSQIQSQSSSQTQPQQSQQQQQNTPSQQSTSQLQSSQPQKSESTSALASSSSSPSLAPQQHQQQLLNEHHQPHHPVLNSHVNSISSPVDVTSPALAMSPVDILTSAQSVAPPMSNLSAEIGDITVPPMDTIDPTQLVSAPPPDPEMSALPANLSHFSKKSKLINVNNDEVNSSLRKKALNTPKLRLTLSKKSTEGDILVPNGNSNRPTLAHNAGDGLSSPQPSQDNDVMQPRQRRRPKRYTQDSPAPSVVGGTTPNTSASIRTRTSLSKSLLDNSSQTQPPLNFPSFTIELHLSKFRGPPDMNEDKTLFREMSDMPFDSNFTSVSTPIQSRSEMLPPASSQPFMRGERGSRGTLRGTRGRGRGRGRGTSVGTSTPARKPAKRSSNLMGFDKDPFSTFNSRRRKRRRTSANELKNLSSSFNQSATPANNSGSFNPNGNDVDSLMDLSNINADWSPDAILQAAGAASSRLQPKRRARAIAKLKATRRCAVEIKRLPRGPDGRPIWQGSAYNIELQAKMAAGKDISSLVYCGTRASNVNSKTTGNNDDDGGSIVVNGNSTPMSSIRNAIMQSLKDADDAKDKDYQVIHDDDSDEEPLSLSLQISKSNKKNTPIRRRKSKANDPQQQKDSVDQGAMDVDAPVANDIPVVSSAPEQQRQKSPNTTLEELTASSPLSSISSHSRKSSSSSNDLNFLINRNKQDNVEDKDESKKTEQSSAIADGLPKCPPPLESESTGSYPYRVLVK